MRHTLLIQKHFMYAKVAVGDLLVVLPLSKHQNQQVYAGSETITATSPTATGNLAVVSVVLPEAAWVNVDYGVVDPNNTLTADSVSFAAQLSGATTRAVAATDYATSKGTSQSSVANSFTVIMNAGTTYITGVAKRVSSASGTSTISNFYINANPIRWS